MPGPLSLSLRSALFRVTEHYRCYRRYQRYALNVESRCKRPLIWNRLLHTSSLQRTSYLPCTYHDLRHQVTRTSSRNATRVDIILAPFIQSSYSQNLGPTHASITTINVLPLARSGHSDGSARTGRCQRLFTACVSGEAAAKRVTCRKVHTI